MPFAHKAFGVCDAPFASLPLSIRSLPRLYSRYPRVPMANHHRRCPSLPLSVWPFADKNQKTYPNKDAP